MKLFVPLFIQGISLTKSKEREKVAHIGKCDTIFCGWCSKKKIIIESNTAQSRVYHWKLIFLNNTTRSLVRQHWFTSKKRSPGCVQFASIYIFIFGSPQTNNKQKIRELHLGRVCDTPCTSFAHILYNFCTSFIRSLINNISTFIPISA